MAYLNLQSIRNKLDLVQCFVVKEDCDILLATETWLEDNATYLFQLNDFSTVHACRAVRGGGVAIYVRKSIQFRVIETSSKDEPISWICISLGTHNLKISVIYKPPSLNSWHFLSIKDCKDLVAGSNFKINNIISEEFATRVTSVSKSMFLVTIVVS